MLETDSIVKVTHYIILSLDVCGQIQGITNDWSFGTSCTLQHIWFQALKIYEFDFIVQIVQRWRRREVYTGF